MKPVPKQFMRGSDKDTKHSYLEVYDLLTDGREISSVLEIGVSQGGSLWLWRAWFPQAEITGIDIKHCPHPPDTHLIVTDVKKFEPDRCWDLIIDDGSHELEDQLWVLNNLTEHLTEKGIMVIEDIAPEDGPPRHGTVESLLGQFKGNKSYLHVIDRRFVKGQCNDILLVYKQSPRWDPD